MKKNKVSTASKIIEQYIIGYEDVIEINDCYKAMIEFAKYHCKAALEAAAEKAELYVVQEGFWANEMSINKDSILSAYPNELIK